MTTISATKADRFANRAPRGGAVSPVNGRFYAGGQFMPMVAQVVEVRPAPLAGSSRQAAWASRLRAAELARLEEEIGVRLIFLARATRPAEAKVYRKAVRPLLIARHGLMAERSASAVIDRRNSTV